MKKVLLVVALVAASVAFAQPASANQGNGQDKTTKAATTTANPKSNLTTTDVPTVTEAVKAPAAPAAPKKVVVCKYVTTPDGALDHIVIVSSNALDGNGFNGTFPFTFDDKHVSVAIRYAKAGEQAHDVSPSECARPSTHTPKTPAGNPVLPDTGGSQLPLLLLALSMIAAGSTILVRTSSGRFGLVRGSTGSFRD